ncbi:HNH endonuclease [Devosia elaeis]|uniref:HNH endonuclease n=1 Tax=Devosia elaeis TaxID=1770058 RepID=UPI0009EEB0A4|nr:HNH endonuclease [Devosia elaeis]
MTKISEAERLWSASIPEPNSGCWIWLQSVNHRGYGQVQFRGKKAKAHRASWMANVGPIPDGQMVLHRCDNRSCINPDHLFLGSAKDNTDDMVRKNRAPNRKLSGEAVRQIRERKARGETYASMAAEFGVSDGTLRQAGRGKNWSAIQ